MAIVVGEDRHDDANRDERYTDPRNADVREHPRWSARRLVLGTLMHFHTTAADSGGAMSGVEQSMRAGFSPPRHVHADQDGLNYVLQGELAVEVAGQVRVVKAGEAAFLPRAQEHSFRATVDSRILGVTTPGGADEFYAENGVPAARLELPDPAPPNIQRLVATARARAIEIVGPPMDGS